MIVDTSAIVAMLLNEPDGPLFSNMIQAGRSVKMSAASLIELEVVAQRKRLSDGDTLDALLAAHVIHIEPVSIAQTAIAREGFRQFGQGSGHPARLNFGDCFAYALAKATGEPLLFKGDDFVHTDIAPAL